MLPIWLLGQYTSDKLELILLASSEEELLIENGRMLQENHLSHAERVINKLLQIDPYNSNYNYRKGFILVEGEHRFKDAIEYLELAVKDIDKNYDMFSLSERSSSIDAWFYLGKSYHRIGEFDKAVEAYNKFLELNNNIQTDLTEFTKLGLTQIEVARKLVQYPKKNIKIENIGGTINSPNPDYCPVISFDGSALYFTSRRSWDATVEGRNGNENELLDQYTEDIYVSYRGLDQKWMPPSRLSFCDAGMNESSLSVSTDERRIYVYSDNVGNGDIFFSDFNDNKLRTLNPYTVKDINTPFWETHCYVTMDGLNIFFTSDRDGGFGGKDIYKITKLPDGSWSKPFNLGPKINTPFDEESPFLALDNKTLYFASNGPKSIGGYDIFVSILDDGEWSNPVNMGVPINSTDDDLFYTETVDGRKGYLSSTRENGLGNQDIYEVTNDYMNVIKGVVFKAKIESLSASKNLPDDIIVKIKGNGDDSDYKSVYPRLRDGICFFLLDPCNEYELVISSKNGSNELYREKFKSECNRLKESPIKQFFYNSDNNTIEKTKPVEIVANDVVVEKVKKEVETAVAKNEVVESTLKTEETVNKKPTSIENKVEITEDKKSIPVVVATEKKSEPKIQVDKPVIKDTVKQVKATPIQTPAKEVVKEVVPTKVAPVKADAPKVEKEQVVQVDKKTIEPKKEELKIAETTPKSTPVKETTTPVVPKEQTVGGMKNASLKIGQQLGKSKFETNQTLSEQAKNQPLKVPVKGNETIQPKQVTKDISQKETPNEVVKEAPKTIATTPKTEQQPVKTSNSFAPLGFKHNFGYNSTKLSVNEGELNLFLKDVEKQLASGRKSITIEVYSSASKVPTKTYVDNQLLTDARAKDMKLELEKYFKPTPYKDKVIVVVAGAIVDGPEYENDPLNIDKYGPYQFVELKTK